MSIASHNDACHWTVQNQPNCGLVQGGHQIATVDHRPGNPELESLFTRIADTQIGGQGASP
jgi:hypothetical protein